MRRKDKEIKDINVKLDIIAKCTICRLGLSENNHPYIIPLNYGYSYEDEKLTLYFHCAKEGRKIQIMKVNKNACFEIDCDTKLMEGEKPCKYSYAFKSIIGFGEIVFLEKPDEIIKGLNHIIKQQTGKDHQYSFDENELKDIIVFKMMVEDFTGKQKVLIRN